MTTNIAHPPVPRGATVAIAARRRGSLERIDGPRPRHRLFACANSNHRRDYRGGGHADEYPTEHSNRWANLHLYRLASNTEPYAQRKKQRTERTIATAENRQRD